MHLDAFIFGLDKALNVNIVGEALIGVVRAHFVLLALYVSPANHVTLRIYERLEQIRFESFFGLQPSEVESSDLQQKVECSL